MKKINYLYVLLFAVIVFMACSDRAYIENRNLAGDSRSNSLSKGIKINIPTSDSYLFGSVDRNIQDSVLKKVGLKSLQEQKANMTRGSGTPGKIYYPIVEQATVQFVPVIEIPQALLGIESQDSLFMINRKIACFYGKGRNGENIYYTARYRDERNVTKDTNPAFYDATQKAYGQKYADDMIEKIRKRRGADCWKVSYYADNSIMFQLFEYARSHSDNGSFFLLTKGEHYFEVCYFKDGQMFSCRKNKVNDPIRVKPVNELM